MYSNEDLNMAIKANIFSPESVDKFRNFVASSQNTTAVDEENFRLITGFNDIFVVIAALLFLTSTTWLLASGISTDIGFGALAGLSWFLSEYFVRKKRMAFPSIVLLLTYIIGVAGFVLGLGKEVLGLNDTFDNEWVVILAGITTMAASYAHWSHFRVPITVAAGVVTFFVAAAVSIGVGLNLDKQTILNFIFIFGIFTFLLAMYWDSSDRNRTTRKSDVAFWLHLAAAPMIVHPIFNYLGILKRGEVSMQAATIVVGLYIFMTLLSVIIDRRSFMVSSLLYVVIAFSKIVEAYGAAGSNLVITGVLIGGLLLLLSVFWHPFRKVLVNAIPDPFKQKVPAVR